MKKLIIIASLFLGACVTKIPPVKERLSIVYLNGDTDTIQFRRQDNRYSGVYFFNSCIYTRRCMTPSAGVQYQSTVVCGVRSYRKL